MFGGKLVKDFNQGSEMIGFEFLNSVLIKVKIKKKSSWKAYFLGKRGGGRR